MEETAVLEIPSEKKKRGRKPKQSVAYVADGELVTDVVDFDSFADKKAKENKSKETTVDNADFKRYIELGGRYYEKTNCVIFANSEFELVVYANGVVDITDGRVAMPCSSRTYEQVVSLVKGFGLTG